MLQLADGGTWIKNSGFSSGDHFAQIFPHDQKHDAHMFEIVPSRLVELGEVGDFGLKEGNDWLDTGLEVFPADLNI